MISSGVVFADKLSKMTETGMRVPVMHACPWAIFGLAEIYGCQFMLLRFYKGRGNIGKIGYYNSTFFNRLLLKPSGFQIKNKIRMSSPEIGLTGHSFNLCPLHRPPRHRRHLMAAKIPIQIFIIPGHSNHRRIIRTIFKFRDIGFPA